MRQLHVIVIGKPAPQGSKRNFGKGRMVESSKAVKPWRESVKWAAIEAAGLPVQPFNGPVSVILKFLMPRPKSAPKRITKPTTKPDIDKLARSTLDALSDARIWRDDSQVVQMSASKHYETDMEPAGADIYVTEVAP